MSLLLHASDLHFGRHDQAALDWFAELVDSERPDAVLITGDLTQSARAHEFDMAARWLEGLSVPLAIEPGNHDLPVFNPLARMLTPYRRFRRLAAAVDGRIDLPDAVVISLKTTARAQLRINWAEGRVGRRSLAAAVAALARTRPGRVRIVAAHHPLVDLPGMQVPGRTHGGRAALHRLAAAGADALLSGHVHDGFDLTHAAAGRSIRLIGAGTLSERLRESPPSCNRIRIIGGGLQVTQLSP
jgi:3',5'-cyclic AMP phosphodiesterase CpdA